MEQLKWEAPTVGVVAYELIKTSNENVYTYKQLHVFTGKADGGFPLGGLTVDAAGNIYGTTSREGDPLCGCGTVFEIIP